MDETPSDISKSFLSLLVALTVPWTIGLIANYFIGEPMLMLVIGLGLSVYTLSAGFQRNGEFENSIGGLFGQMTTWVIPSGISWWLPEPFGQALRKVSIEKKTLYKSVASGKPFTQVKTRDGVIVEVGVVKTWHISDARKAANFVQEDLEKQVTALLDRGVRYFALYFDSGEAVDTRVSALSHRRADFSLYLQGSEDIIDLYGKEIPNEIKQKARELGITIDNIDVVDVNEPKEVQNARNKAAAEQGQAVAEKLDVKSIRNRVLELMWGTSDLTKIKRKKKAGESPLISEAEALRAVRSARGDLEDINVSGGGGDFTKGAAIQRSPKQKGGKK